MVQTPGESGGKSWLKEISMTVRRDTDKTPKTKNAASRRKRRFVDHDT
jgi:hypothetical protein